MLKFMTRFLVLPVFFFIFACTPQAKIKAPLPASSLQPELSSSVVLSHELSEPSSSDTLSLGLPEAADVKVYPKAITQAQEATTSAVDASEKGQAHLSLMILHLNRANPDQDFNAASRELDLAVQADPTLLRQPSIQRWLDVFSRLNAIRKGHEVIEQLRQENKILRKSLEEKESEILSLSTTLEELNRMELDVEKKRRLYR